jgi:hypothetical protein
MGGSPAPVSRLNYQPAASPYPTSTFAFESVSESQQSAPVSLSTQAKNAPKSSVQTHVEKPLVFKYPLFWRILMYLFILFFGCAGLLVASENVVNSLPFLGLALLMGLTAMAFSPKVEITEGTIRASGMFSSSEINWKDITRIQSSAIKRRLELFRSNGEIVKVSTQVSGYPQIVEILRQKRPDLFGMPSAALAQGGMYSSRYEQTPSNIYGGSSPSLAFSGTKTFKKNFFAQYGAILLMIPLCLVSVWLIVSTKDYSAGIGIGLVALFFMSTSLFAIHIVKVQANKLLTESFFGEKEFTAGQIKNISMKTVRSRRGVANNFVHIEPVEGSAFSLGGFPEGEEIMYGFLMNWWNASRNK